MSLFTPTFFASLFLVNLSVANFTASSKTNIGVYWGQGPGQLPLSHLCQQATIDVITLAFVDVFPAQGNGYPGTSFGNQCWGDPYVYSGPGNTPTNNSLQAVCPQMVADIPICQNTYGKKVILSLGGGTNGYQLTGAANGIAFADFLWGAFGPQTTAWVVAGKPRPFDGAQGQAVEVDGFDFDIELPSTDSSAGYIAMIKRLRSNFATAKKTYLITGAPQCVVPDPNMATMISGAQFDILWIQFYNTASCSARNWATANPQYSSTHKELASGFSYDAWTAFLVGTASSNAKLYIGLAASTTAATNPSFYLTTSQVANLAQAYFCRPNFGGIMLWEATYAEKNVVNGLTYYQVVKNILVGYGAGTTGASCTARSSSSLSKSLSSTEKTTTISFTLTQTKTTIIKTTSTRYSSSRSSSSSSTARSTRSTSKSSSSSAKISLSSSSSSRKLTTSTSTSSSSVKTSSKSTKSTSSPLPAAPAGGCGAGYAGAPACAAGYCCSKNGYCGTAATYCGIGCQKGFGICY
ncbi:glycoside hydrolase family 18 protein [Coleophoma crateriformis]|uniref:chitinase n=1 Tax=Coleophoma crateriformis TaxID=565419 RepID=A0A3D8RPK2_9HELO|nr:glycoside hydrolase family 18 protein [Coleophoma crateriformis]